METFSPLLAGSGPATMLLIFVLALPTVGLARAEEPPDEEPPDPESAEPDESPPAQAAFRLSALEAKLAASEGPWLPFFDSRTLRLGLYSLEAGAADEQPVHDEDEVYHVLRGRAVLRAGDELIPVEPGSVVFVRAGVEHRFIDVEEDLEVLVIFGAPLPEEAGGETEGAP